MILLRNVSFEQQLKFLYDNICPLPDELDIEALSILNHNDFREGMRAFHAFLNRFYSNGSFIQQEDDDKKLVEYIFTMYFLFAFFITGELENYNGKNRIQVDKKALSKEYRKGNVSARIRHITHHGFNLKYLAGDSEVNSSRKADTYSLGYPAHSGLISAVKAFADKAALIERNNRVIYQGIGAFLKGDVETVFGIQSVYRDTLDPYRGDILRTVGDYRQSWVQLVDKLRDQCQLLCSGFLHHHACPSWGVSFFEGRKKPLLIFTLGPNIVFVEFTVPVKSAQEIILDRHRYSPIIREKIERFHCVNCPKQCKGANIVKIDGVSLCTGRAEARRIYVTLRTPEDFNSIHTMLDTLYV